MFGELLPLGGGDPIPLLKRQLLVGRRESCDIVLRFANVSAHHCQLTLNGGYWYVKDLGSRNHIKVNEVRVTERRLDPGDTLAVAKHNYEIQYSPIELGAIGPPPAEDTDLPSEIFNKPLLERAGLAKHALPDDDKKRYDPLNNEAGQIKDRNRPT
jgi:adenylate cyclase